MLDGSIYWGHTYNTSKWCFAFFHFCLYNFEFDVSSGKTVWENGGAAHDKLYKLPWHPEEPTVAKKLA